MTRSYVVVNLLMTVVVVVASVVHLRLEFFFSLVTQVNAGVVKGFTLIVTFDSAGPGFETSQVLFVADGTTKRRRKRKCRRIGGSSRR